MSKHLYIFGGTFDPPHQGHLGVIKELKDKTVIIAPTFANPFKNQSKYSFKQRVSMLKAMLDYEKIEYKNLDNVIKSKSEFRNKVLISDFKYEYVCDFVSWIKSKYDCTLTWVIGPDLVEQVKTWKNWDEMKLELYVSKTHFNDIRSTEVRKGEKELHPALRDFK